MYTVSMLSVVNKSNTGKLSHKVYILVYKAERQVALYVVYRLSIYIFILS